MVLLLFIYLYVSVCELMPEENIKQSITIINILFLSLLSSSHCHFPLCLYREKASYEHENENEYKCIQVKMSNLPLEIVCCFINIRFNRILYFTLKTFSKMSI